MPSITGANLYVKFGTTVLDTDYRSFGHSENMGVVDESAGADTARTYLTTLEDGTATLTILLQADDTTTWGAIDIGTEATLEWGDEGTTAGDAKHTVNAIVTGRSKSFGYADVVTCDVEFQFSGAVADNTY